MTHLNNTNQPTKFQFPKATIDNHALLSLPTKWVKTQNELQELIDELDTVDVVALDTEFIKRDTYYPILALIQVNTGKTLYLVDVPCLDLTKFWQVLCQVPVMVWYACGEDLGIFYLLADNPPLTNVFDVQIGVAYLTGKLQVGYSQSVHEILGIALDKGESQSDWLARPLTHKQEQYALNDVRYLLALYESVKENLIKNKSLNYAIEDCTLYAKELHAAQNIADDQLYLDFVAPNYNRVQLSTLKALTAWREKLARATNKPRSFIIGKQPLREIIETLPTNIKELSTTTINRASLRRHGNEIVAIIKHAKELPTHQMPTKIPAYTSKAKPFRQALNQAIDEHANLLGVPSNLLLKGRWIDELLYHIYQDKPAHDTQDLSDGLNGYRRIWVVKVVLPLLYQHKKAIDDGFDCGFRM
ncbi:MAG: HRDC domain-containing protein [Moraxella sp.]|uniref:ribonuclease D n=1 Tax=Moraxella sp. TaxID=479 RepID=UPI0026DD2931|nr:HRDC domain-containing protein [Moraxella sp.]MDO4450015.1 HRDC domain-containing protein [Moraxella sp.]